MKIARIALGLILLPGIASTALAQEHTFGVRAGSFQFPESEIFTESLEFTSPANYSGGELDTDLSWTREFEPEEFSGVLWEFFYTFRRDTEAHFQMDLSAGLFSKEATHVVPGTAVVEDLRSGPGGPYGDTVIPADVSNTLEYTLYYVQIEPTYQFTTGKFRFFLGGGVGLWANLWREVADAFYLDIFTCQRPDVNTFICPPEAGTVQLRLSAGNRRTIVPFTASAGFFYQFLPHWSLNFQTRYVFNGESSVNMFREDSDFSINGNQLLVGFSYRL